MDIKEAFHKQKNELHACQREVRRLQKQVERFAKGVAEEETFQKQLSHIQGLNNKLSEQVNIANRYRNLYEQEKKSRREICDRYAELESHCQHLQWLVDCLTGERTAEGATAAQRADARIRALEDEVARLTALCKGLTRKLLFPS